MKNLQVPPTIQFRISQFGSACIQSSTLTLNCITLHRAWIKYLTHIFINIGIFFTYFLYIYSFIIYLYLFIYILIYVYVYFYSYILLSPIYLLEIKLCGLGPRIWDMEAFWYKTEIKIIYFVPLCLISWFTLTLNFW